MNDFFGHLSDDDYVKKRSCLNEVSSSLLVIKSLTGQRKSVGKENNIKKLPLNIPCDYQTHSL